MSRRKPKPPAPAPGAVRSYTLKVVCGDKGQHPPMVLHHLADMRGHDLPQAFTALPGRNKLKVKVAEDGTVLYCFRCFRCLKTPHPVPEATLAEVYDALSAATGDHHPVIDISALP